MANAVTVQPDETLRAAAEMLTKNDADCLVVVEGRDVVGVLTQEVVRRVTIST